jgi:hypothetical protein
LRERHFAQRRGVGRFGGIAQLAVPAVARVVSGVRRNELTLPSARAPVTRFGGPVSPHRVFSARTFPLDDVKAMRRHVPGATVNDVALALVDRRGLVGSRERLDLEADATAALQHPHILPLFDSGTADGFLFYVMPFIDGETLQAMGNRFDGHIVMRRANAASGKDVVKGARERHDITGNHLELIRDHHNASDIYTQDTEFLA